MRTGIIRHAAAALCLVTVAACQTPTPYKAAVTQNDDGYSTQRIEANRFRISFKGNSLTTRQTVDTYMLYRAAEVTLQNAGDYFIVVNKDVDKSTGYENYGDDLAWGWGGGWGLASRVRRPGVRGRFSAAAWIIRVRSIPMTRSPIS